MKNVCVLALSLWLAACANGPPPLTGPSLAVLPTTELPPPPAFADGRADGYRIGPLDKMDIDVFGIEELSRRELQADSAGRVSFPLAGTIDAHGMSTDQLAREIENRLRGGRYVLDPHVTVNLREAVSQAVTVDGEVRKPGRYPAVRGTTLMQAIASAEGVSEFARLNQVVVFRTVGEQDMAALYDLGAIRGGRYADPHIYPGDVVVVGDSPGRRLFRNILLATPLITTPIVALLQRN